MFCNCLPEYPDISHIDGFCKTQKKNINMSQFGTVSFLSFHYHYTELIWVMKKMDPRP
jgi:hypothetical protein